MPVVTIRRLPKQREFYECNDKWAAGRGGVGAGKTTAVVWWMLERLEKHPRATHFAIGASYEQLRAGIFESVVGFLEHTLGWERDVQFRYREAPSPMLTLLPSGARLRSLSSEQRERIAGLQMQTAVCEEPQSWIEGEAFYQLVVERLRHNPTSAVLYPEMVPKGRMTFNPPARGHWLQKMIEQRWPKLGYKCWQFSLRENVLMVGLDSYVRDIENATSLDRWANRIDGEWATSGGSVYRMFDEDVHGNLPTGVNFEIDMGRPLLWAHDFNVQHMSSVICQEYDQPTVADAAVPQNGIIPGWQRMIVRVLGEIVLHDVGTPDTVTAFLDRYGDVARKTGVTLFGDPSGGARSQTASAQSAIRTNWDAIEQGLTAAGITWTKRVPPAHPSVGDRINEVNSQLRTGEGPGLVLDPARVPTLVSDFMRVERASNGVDIEKRRNPELTHMCLVGETLVSTERGAIKIADVAVNDRVWTRAGLRRVTYSGLTGHSQPIMSVKFSNGSEIRATPNHPVFVKSRNAFVPAGDLRVGDECITISECIPLNFKEDRTQKRQREVIGKRGGAIRSARNIFTGMFGKASTDQSRTAGTSIISTKIRPIMPSKISNACPQVSTTSSTAIAMSHGAKSAPKTAPLRECASSPRRGTLVPRGAPGMQRTAEQRGLIGKQGRTNAFSAGWTSGLLRLKKSSCIAAKTAKPRPVVLLESTLKNGLVFGAGACSKSIDTCRPRLVAERVLALSGEGRERADVYDLTVEGEHEFFANGVLVSNSDAIGYMIVQLRKPVPTYFAFYS